MYSIREINAPQLCQIKTAIQIGDILKNLLFGRAGKEKVKETNKLDERRTGGMNDI